MTEPALPAEAKIKPDPQAKSASGGLMDDLDEAIRSSPNYKRIATATPQNDSASLKPSSPLPGNGNRRTQKGGNR